MMTLYVGFCGYLVHVAADGVEAIDMAVRVNPHIILMDLMMPRMDGLEATRRLKADARTKEITIIALSARSLADQADDGRHAGCDAFMRKPCDLDLLGDVLRDFFERRAHPATATDH